MCLCVIHFSGNSNKLSFPTSVEPVLDGLVVNMLTSLAQCESNITRPLDFHSSYPGKCVHKRFGTDVRESFTRKMTTQSN